MDGGAEAGPFGRRCYVICCTIDKGRDDVPIQTGQPIFRMPLDAQGETSSLTLESLDHAIRGARHNTELPRPCKSMLVKAVDTDCRITDRSGKDAFGLNRDFVRETIWNLTRHMRCFILGGCHWQIRRKGAAKDFEDAYAGILALPRSARCLATARCGRPVRRDRPAPGCRSASASRSGSAGGIRPATGCPAQATARRTCPRRVRTGWRLRSVS